MIDKNRLINEISNKDDRILIASLIDKYKKYCVSNKLVSSSFLNEHQELLVRKYIPNLPIYKVNEMCSKSIISKTPDDINILKITPVKDIAHKDVLGCLFSLGLTSSMIGDIFIEEDCIYLTALSRMTNFLIDNLTCIKKIPVKISITDDLVLIKNHLEVFNCFVTSMRLDTIVSSLANISRSKAVFLITSKMVLVNYQIQTKIKDVRYNDIISIKKVGKFKIGNILLETKKNKKKLEVYKYV